MSPSASSQISPERLMQFTFGFAPPLMIEAAIRHGVFDILDKGAKTLDALCAETGTSTRGLQTLLNALVGLNVLSKDATGHYALTEESATYLVAGKPTYHGAFFLLTSGPMLSSWGKLHEVVRSGRTTHRINREQDGVAFFLQFVEDIFPIHYAGAQALAKALAVSNVATPISVLDLAAGSGVWSVALAQQSPHIRVTSRSNFDRGAEEKRNIAPAARRCSTVREWNCKTTFSAFINRTSNRAEFVVRYDQILETELCTLLWTSGDFCPSPFEIGEQLLVEATTSGCRVVAGRLIAGMGRTFSLRPKQ
jgi:hypothetical protein